MKPAKDATGLQFSAALSTKPDTAEAIRDACDGAMAQLGAAPNFALAFVSPHHAEHFAELASQICDRIGTESLLGCTGESIVGGDREIEDQPALAIWLASVPGMTIHLMHLETQQTQDGESIAGWPIGLPEEWPGGSALFVLGDPFTFSIDSLLSHVNDSAPGVPVLGGMSSGAMGPGQNRLFLGREELESGAVAALVYGPIRIRSVVSQGCRPIGEHFVITRSNRNVIQELGGQPPLAHLQQLFPTLSANDQRLVQRGLHLGRVVDEYKERYGRGDFLVRNVIGADPGSGAIAVGELVRPGQTVQFHVRDGESADEDLQSMVAASRGAGNSAPLAALLFTCNGRGTRLFPKPHHDAGVIRQHLGEIPTAGFFAQGELGPIGGKNFIHGFTATVVLFEAPGHD